MYKMNPNNHLEDIIFDKEKVMSELEKLKNGSEKISFINEVLLLRKKKKEYYDPDKYSDEPTLDDKLNNLLKLINEENVKGTNEQIITEFDLNDLIWWKGTEGQLIYLFEKLVKNNLIDDTFDERKYVYLSMHFKNKKSKRFTSKQMSQAAQNLVINKDRKPTKAEALENIIKEIKNDE